MKKRILCLMMTMVMLVAMMPMSASAQSTTIYPWNYTSDTEIEPYLSRVLAIGIVKNPKNYSPHRNLSFAQFVSFLARATGYKTPDDVSGFKREFEFLSDDSSYNELLWILGTGIGKGLLDYRYNLYPPKDGYELNHNRPYDNSFDSENFNLNDCKEWAGIESYEEFEKHIEKEWSDRYTSPIQIFSILPSLIYLAGYEKECVENGGTIYDYIEVAKDIGLFEGTGYDTMSLQEIFNDVDHIVTITQVLKMLDNALRLPMLLTEKEYTTVSRSKERLKSTTNEKLSSPSDGYAFYLGLNTMSGKVIGVSDSRNTITLEVWQGNKSEWQNFTLSKEVGGLEIDVNGIKGETVEILVDTNKVIRHLAKKELLKTPTVTVEKSTIKVGEVPKFKWNSVANADFYTVWDWTRERAYDGIKGKTCPNFAPYTKPGTYAIGVYARDSKGNYAQSIPYSFNITVIGEEEKQGSFSPTPQQGETMVIVNGKKVEFDVPPQIINDRTMIPIRAVVEAFGAKVEWEPKFREIYISGKIVASKDPSRVGKIMNMNLGIGRQSLLCVITEQTPTSIKSALNTEFYIPENLDSPPVIVDDRTLVPLRAIVELFGYSVEWDAETKTVKIN